MNTLWEQVFDQLLGQGAKRYGDYFACRCIFHTDHNPSMFVHEDGYTCKACGARGSLKHLAHVLNGQPPRRVQSATGKPRLTPWWNLENIEEYCLDAYDFLNNFPDLTYYLNLRGLTERTIQELRIGYGDGYYCFPIFDSQRSIVGAVARCGEAKADAGAPRYITPWGFKGQLYNPDPRRIAESSRIYIPYGIIDMVTLYQMGYPTMAFTAGKDMKPELLDPYRKIIVLIPDRGEEVSGLRLWAKLGWRGKTLFPNWPDGTKDINEVYVKYGEEAVRRIIENAH